MRKFKFFIILMLGLSSLPAYLLSQNATINLSLDSAISYALQYNKTLINAKLSIVDANKALWETISKGLPQASATIDYANYLGYEIEIRFNENLPPAKIKSKPTSNFKFAVNQLIFNGAYYVGIKLAELSKHMIENNAVRTELEIKKQVSNAYFLAQISASYVKILNSNLNNIRDVYEKTKVMVAAGVRENTDADQLAIRVADMEAAVRSAERQLELSHNLLRLQMGLNIETKLNLTDSLPFILSNIDYLKLLTDSLDLEKNVDYRMALLQEDLAKKQITLQKMSFLPTITGMYSYTYKFLKPDFDMTPPNLVAININIPIFSSGMRLAQVSQAKVKYLQAKNNRELIKEQIQIREKQARYNLKNALETYENRKNSLVVSKRVYENINLKYQHGAVSSLDLITAHNNYLQSESQYLESVYQLLQSIIELENILYEIN